MQSAKRDILKAAKAAGLLAAARARSARAVRILCYHGLWLGDPVFGGDSMFMRPATFRRRMELIRALGYPVVPLAAALDALCGKGPTLPPAAVVITIDDGWASTSIGMLPVLEALDMPATLYCDSAQLLRGGPRANVMAHYLDRVAALQPAAARTADIDFDGLAISRRAAADLTASADERLQAATALGTALGLDMHATLATRTFDYMSPVELAAAHARGLDVQLHTHNHTLGDMSRGAIESEVRQNRQSLARILSTPPESFNAFCYPSGVTSDAAARTLAGLGLNSATTTVQALAWPGADMHLLPRLLDGENLSEIEFEAELSGFGDWLRAGRRAVRRVTGRAASRDGAANAPAMLRP